MGQLTLEFQWGERGEQTRFIPRGSRHTRMFAHQWL